MIRPRLRLLVLIAALAGCDDSTVTNVGRRTFLSGSELAAKLGNDALLVEVHGVSWAGADPEEIVATLRMPEGKARDICFQGIPPGQGYFGGGRRLVLRFNPPAGVNIRDDCRATRPLPVMAPQDDRFTVNASY